MNSQKGFSLIELVLYLSLLAILLLSSTLFLATILQGKVKNQAINEVEQQGLQVMQQITQSIKNAQTINSPAVGTSTSVSINTFDALKNPTIFDLYQGAIRIKESGGAAIPLTSSKVTASNLIFQNLTRNGTPSIVNAQFTLAFQNPSGASEYNYSKTFNSSAEQRTP